MFAGEIHIQNIVWIVFVIQSGCVKAVALIGTRKPQNPQNQNTQDKDTKLTERIKVLKCCSWNLCHSDRLRFLTSCVKEQLPKMSGPDSRVNRDFLSEWSFYIKMKRYVSSASPGVSIHELFSPFRCHHFVFCVAIKVKWFDLVGTSRVGTGAWLAIYFGSHPYWWLHCEGPDIVHIPPLWTRTHCSC